MAKPKTPTTVRTIEIIEKANKVDFMREVNQALRNQNCQLHGPMLVAVTAQQLLYIQAITVDVTEVLATVNLASNPVAILTAAAWPTMLVEEPPGAAAGLAPALAFPTMLDDAEPAPLAEAEVGSESELQPEGLPTPALEPTLVEGISQKTAPVPA